MTVDINFLVGCPRSGTTLLSTLIGRHSQILVPPETHFADQLLPKGHKTIEFSHEYTWASVDHSRYLRHLNVSAEIVRKTFRGIAPTFKNLFLAYLEAFANAHNYQNILEKTPDHLYCYDILSSWFPQAKFIAIVRDGRAVAQSLTKTPWGSRDPKANIQTWMRAAKQHQRIVTEKRNVITVQYEELIQQTIPTLKKIMSFLGFDLEACQLNTKLIVPNIAPGEEVWKAQAAAQISRAKLSEWRNEISKQDMAFCESVAKDYLEYFGYSISRKTKLSPYVVNSIVKEVSGSARRTAKRIVGKKCESLLGCAQPKILPCDLALALRGEVLRKDLKYKISATNCGFAYKFPFYYGVFKNGNFHYYSHDLGIPLPNPVSPVRQKLYLVVLDETFRVVEVSELKVNINGVRHDSDLDLLEDVRLALQGQKLFGTVVHIPNNRQREAGVLFCELDEKTRALDCWALTGAANASPQKNWVPFVFNEKVYIQQDLSPFVIYEIDADEKRVAETYRSDSIGLRLISKGIRLSGGTPLICFGDVLLGISHAYRVINGRRWYYSFFYTVNCDSGFAVQRMSKAFRFADEVPIQFATGLALDWVKRELIVSYGVADCDSYFVRVPVKDVELILEKCIKLI